MLELGDLAGVEDVADVAQLLVDPQPDVGVAGKDCRLRMCRSQRDELRDRARREEAPASRGVLERFGALDRLQLCAQCIAIDA